MTKRQLHDIKSTIYFVGAASTTGWISLLLLGLSMVHFFIEGKASMDE